MERKAVPNPDPYPAGKVGGWYRLAAMLAPGAGCDCQMLALTIADGVGAAKPAEVKPAAKKIAER